MTASNFYVHPSAYVDEPCEIGEGVKIWHFCHVMQGARIGRGCILGQNVFVANDVKIGNNVKIQNKVPDYALMLGVPAIQKGWISRHGHRLANPEADGVYRCPESGWRYRQVEPGALHCLDWPEDEPLP